MRKSTKGAVAASAALLLLMGGWGTHATWEAGATSPGTDMATGHLKLISGGCGNGWQLNGIDLTTLSANELLLVPGSILTETCTFTVDVAGVMNVELSTTTPSYSNDPGDLSSILSTNAVYKKGATVLSDQAVLVDNDVITADITVTLGSAVTDGQDLAATLDAITVSATQA